VRKILDTIAKEDHASWAAFLRYLKGRGLREVKLFTSDKCLGLVESLGEFYPEAKWQRCVVHFYNRIHHFNWCGLYESPVELISSVSRRRRWKLQEKKAIVKETEYFRESFSTIATKPNIPNQLFRLRLVDESGLFAVKA